MTRAVRQLLTSTDCVELFHTERQEAYAGLPVRGHQENWPIASDQFGDWLARTHYAKTNDVVSTHLIREAQKILAAKARFDGEQRRLYLRVAELDGRLYLDLANAQWQVIEMDQSGWRLLDCSPVPFRRSRGMRSLTEPQRGGSLSDLEPFLNVAGQDSRALIVGYMMSALRPHGPYPVLQLAGEQGSTKTTTARMIASLVDPKEGDLRSEPSSVRDLMIAAEHSWVLCFDNLSWVPEWLSDAFCRLATGGGFATRELYSDRNQTLLDAQRPIILTGIADLATRGDLLDRSVVIELPTMAPERRRPEFELWREFEIARPRILGALLDGVVGALKNLPTTSLPRQPRMADFVVFGSAAETGLGWPTGTFLAAYEENHACLRQTSLESSPVTAVLMRLLHREGCWRGTASGLLHALNDEAGVAVVRQRAWPRNAKLLSDLLRRLASSLRATGITVEFWRSADRRRIRMIGLECASAASTASAIHDFDTDNGGQNLSASEQQTQTVPDEAADLFYQAIAETRLVLDRAKREDEGFLHLAASRELRTLALQLARGNVSRSRSHNAALQQIERMTNAQLEQFIRERALELGFRAPAEGDSGDSDGGESGPPCTD